jgi:hypothetical protein
MPRKYIVEPYTIPTHQNLQGWGLSYEGYALLCAIANYSHGHIQDRAKFYLSGDVSVEEKKLYKSGDGGFMSAILRGDLLDAWWKASETHRDALNRAIFQGEIQLPSPQMYYREERERIRRHDMEMRESH